MSRYAVEPLDLSGISTYRLDSRPSKVTVADFARRPLDARSAQAMLATLPDILAAKQLRELAARIKIARDRGKAIIAGLGGHVIKTGLSPILIELMRQGFITAFAMNGSAVIHDLEIALAGATSEDVDATLGSGSFGMAEETAGLMNGAVKKGAQESLGIGESVGRALSEMQPRYSDYSLLVKAYEARVPVTVHIAIGTDIVHVHPSADGAAIGAGSLRDFRLLCAIVRELNSGGVYLNLGSAVVLPEVFLKTVTVVRNLGFPLEDFTTSNFDFIQHYRPLTNVVRRSVAGSGRGFSFTGHHELMIPMLAAALIAEEQ